MSVETPATKRERSTGLRRPSRGRGIARYQALLEATEALLQDANPDEIGLYQIAERAGVPPASVYHFFPTKETAYQALAERYLQGLIQVHSQPIEARLIKSWQDLVELDMRRAMDYFNARPAMLKILYGGYGGVEARNIDILVTDHMAQTASDRLNLIFHVPVQRDAAKKTQISLALLDAIWTISVRLHGRITEEYLEEAFRVVVMYRRLYLPEVLEPREMLIKAAAEGGAVTLPYPDASPGPAQT
ncbi:TetR/AcrR family transcriptional regulator [Phenylobacterium sp.]|uniref:TetR/AcrR family transcriptional regulator n=1 Tax=Phenylobacterium sp. TaxID=1871053 RepID=UPI002BB40C18|nr:TetR/AcrR family transcriptional regulator [Phenylobacterium sp.]HVI33610.1 TetR/AcrR family transcriptional regulator [Phenylobacterium sp.]